MMDATEAGEDTAAAEDDHSLSYQSVQEIRRAFESFWADYATTFSAAGSDSDATGVDRLDELHQRYVQRYLAHVEVLLGDGQRTNEGSRTTDDGAVQTLSDALPALDSDAEDDSEIDARISKVLQQQDQQHDQSLVGSRRDRPRKRTHSELSSSHQRRRSANPPQRQKQQHPPPSTTTAATTTKAKALRQRPQIRPLTSGVLSSIVLVNSYDTPSTLRTLAAAKRKKQAALKRKRKGESDLDVDALWAAHWRMKSFASARKMNDKLKSISANARPPYLKRALRRGKRCYKL